MDVQTVAKKLSEAMRTALAYFPNGYTDPNTVKALRRRGLIYGMNITALGQQVRDHLNKGDQP